MRTIVGWFFAWLVIVYSLCLAFGISYQVSGISSGSFKQALVAANLYETLSDQLSVFLADSVKTTPKSDPTRKLAGQLSPFLTPAYLQSKADGLIDQTALWLTVKNSPPPLLSFADIKETLLAKNPRLIADLQKLDEEYQKAKPELEAALKQQAESQGETYSPPPNLSFQSFISHDFTLPLADSLSWLKPLAWLASWLGIAASLVIVLLGCIALFFIHPPAKRFTKVANLLVFIAGLLNVYLLFNLPFIDNLLQNSPAQTWSLPVYLYPILNEIINPFLLTYYQVAGFLAGAYLSAAFALRRLSAKVMV